MSQNQPFVSRLTIEPEPTAEELIAILWSRQRVQVVDEPEPTSRSRWYERARQEQLHHPLDDHRTGWNR